MYKEFWEFLSLLKDRQIDFLIMGNPFHLSLEIAKKLKEYGCQSYQMSIDGLEKTHDSFRKSGSFAATLEKISCIAEAGILPAIMTTVSKANAHELLDIIELIAHSKVSRMSFARYSPTHGDTENLLSPSEYRDLLEKCWATFSKYKDLESPIFILKDHLWSLFLYEKGLLDIDENRDLIVDGCNCGLAHMSVAADGTVYACRHFESPVGKVPEQSLYDIFFSDEIDKYRCFEKFDACAKCKLLNYCRGCPAVSLAQQEIFTPRTRNAGIIRKL